MSLGHKEEQSAIAFITHRVYFCPDNLMTFQLMFMMGLDTSSGRYWVGYIIVVGLLAVASWGNIRVDRGSQCEYAVLAVNGMVLMETQTSWAHGEIAQEVRSLASAGFFAINDLFADELAARTPIEVYRYCSTYLSKFCPAQLLVVRRYIPRSKGWGALERVRDVTKPYG